MGYLATAWVFAQEGDSELKQEARDLVESAERQVKHCAYVEQDRFTLLAILRTKWPIWWLLQRLGHAWGVCRVCL